MKQEMFQMRDGSLFVVTETNRGRWFPGDGDDWKGCVPHDVEFCFKGWHWSIDLAKCSQIYQNEFDRHYKVWLNENLTDIDKAMIQAGYEVSPEQKSSNG